MDIFNDNKIIKDLDEDESSSGGGEEQKPVGQMEEENRDTVLSPKRRSKFKYKKLIIIAASGFILIALIFVLKAVFFKKGPRIRQALFPLKQTKPIIDKSSLFPAISSKPVQTKPVPASDSIASEDLKTDNAAVKKTNLVKNNKIGNPSKALIVPALPPMSLKSIKQMMKFNSRINELREKVKIARLEQEIKSLNQTGAGGINNASISNISLLAVTKDSAIIAFGKNDVSMTVGMKYTGYECLMINSKGVALEKNNRVINLSLSM